MAKKSRTKNREAASQTAAPVGEVGPRQPCPCGSGKRYKACHGDAGAVPFVKRPFEGLPSECDIIAMRELVPAAHVELTVPDAGERQVRLCTLLPAMAPALVRESGDIWLGLQVRHNYGDPARDLGAVLEAALATEEVGMIGLTSAPGAGKRLQDFVTDKSLQIQVHDGFGYWLDDVPERGPEMEAALEQANAAAQPTARLASVEAAYWTNVGTKEHLRWVRPEPEDELLDALSRLHAADQDRLIDDSRFVGMFRAHGLLTPVWDLPVGTGPEAIEDAAAAFGERLTAALGQKGDLSAAERAARAGLTNRQVTIR